MSRPRTRSSTASRAVSTKTGIGFSAARRRRSTSKPSMRGRPISRITRSKCSCEAASTASSPRSVTSTAWPSASRIRHRPEASGASSSTISSLIGSGAVRPWERAVEIISDSTLCARGFRSAPLPPRYGGARMAALQKAPPEACMSGKGSMKGNGKTASAELEARALLVTFIRENLRLTGTHVGCDTAQCGACTVLMNGRAIKSCSIVAMQAEGADIMTIEGVAKPDGTLHPMQQAFKENHGLQCGFCTPGMVMNALDFAKSHPNPTEKEVRESLEGNLCRCTGYHNIVKSIIAGAQAMGGKI